MRTLDNIFSNVFSGFFVPNKVVTSDDRDQPWMTEYIKTKIQQYHIFKNYLRSSRSNQDYQCLQSAIDDVSNAICERKCEYYNQLAQRLTDPTTSSETYWSVLKTFVNGKRHL